VGRTIAIERNVNEAGWETVKSWTSSMTPLEYRRPERPVVFYRGRGYTYYRINVMALTAGEVFATYEQRDYHFGLLRIDTVVNPQTATITVMSDLGFVVPTKRWAKVLGR